MAFQRFLFRVMLLACLMAVSFAPANAADPLVRSTAFGEVMGIEDDWNTWSWQGIPFAKAPVGELRWNAPVDPEPWSGTRVCDSFCSYCVQYGNYISETGYESMGGFMRKGVMTGDEDCLYLNVWRPRTCEEGLPVYVFIHGGANVIGRSDLSIYDGAHFASEANMLFVTLNYRLGTFGWFAHPALRTGDPLGDSGNFGTLDIIKALTWIQNNIESFGGDPGNVTVCGQSAGAMNIYTLLASPPAEGLFHRAVLMSGAPAACSMDNAEKISLAVIYRLLEQDGYASGESAAEEFLAAKDDAWLRGYLLSKTPDELYPPENGGPTGLILDRMSVPSGLGAGFIDGYVIAEHPYKAMKTGTYHRVPLMLGNTTEEIKLFLPFFFTDPSKLWMSLYNYDPDNPKYKLSDFLSVSYWYTLPFYNLVASVGQLVFQSYGVDTSAHFLADHQQDVYAYKFAWDEEPKPFDFFMGAAHALDIAFVFGNFPSDPEGCTHMAWSEKNRAGREELSEAMMRYHAQFARTGDPNTGDLTPWLPWSNAKRSPKRIILDTDEIYMSTKYAEPFDLPCPQCTIEDLVTVFLGLR